jgi:hypothetical protein
MFLTRETLLEAILLQGTEQQLPSKHVSLKIYGSSEDTYVW